jgi:hypothetical protein
MPSSHYHSGCFFELFRKLPSVTGDDVSFVETPISIEAFVYFLHAVEMVLVQDANRFNGGLTFGLEKSFVTVSPQQFSAPLQRVSQTESIELLKLSQVVLALTVSGEKVRILVKDVITSLVKRELDDGPIG